MIGSVLNAIKELLEADIGNGTGDSTISLNNIAHFDSLGNVDGNILMSLVNIEQDIPLRNNPAYSSISETQIVRHNPKIILNLNVLFSAINLDAADQKYELDYLTQVIAFFQKKNVFEAAELNLLPDSILQTEKVIFDLMSLSFEQLNHLWGILGGKYLPSVLYKVRLVTVYVEADDDPEVVIQTTEEEANILSEIS